MELVSICRTCLARETHKNISDLKTQPGDNCSDILLFCLNIKVEDDSKISTNLCLKCFKKVMAFYKFKLLALKNDAYLKTVESEDSVKNEIYLQDDDIKIENNLNDHQESSCGSDIGDSLLSIKIEPQAKEDEADGQSDNELLSVIKKIKYEFVADPIEETKENSPAKKPKRKRGRPPNPEGRRKKPAAISQICEECGKTVKNLKEHSLQHLPAATRKMYSCKSCDKKFASYGARSKHNKRKHLGLKKTCPICNKMVSDVWAHRRVSHEPASLRHACASCGRRFISPSALRAHASMHTRAMPYACDACGKRFRVKLLMQQHRRRVHENEKSHMCQFCSKSFFKKYHLQVHIRSHTKEKPYKCPECNKCFSTTTILNNHSLAVHSGVKRHACTLCSMTFARPGYLRVHMISHTKEKKHPCKYCGIRFGRSDHRKRHEFTAHERHLITNLDPKDLGSTIEAQVKRTRLPKETAIVEPSHDVTSVSYYDTTDRGDCVEYEKTDDQFHVKTDSPFRGGRKRDELSG